MSYCKFENTYKDLKDCYKDITSDDLSSDETRYRDKLVELCRDIVDEYDNTFSEEESE
jgi:hypothetical protein